jgi:hypothetical protein
VVLGIGDVVPADLLPQVVIGHMPEEHVDGVAEPAVGGRAQQLLGIARPLVRADVLERRDREDSVVGLVGREVDDALVDHTR